MPSEHKITNNVSRMSATAYCYFHCIFAVLGMIALTGSFYAYQSRTEYLDILGIQRKRFVAISTKQIERLASMEFEEVSS